LTIQAPTEGDQLPQLLWVQTGQQRSRGDLVV